MCVKLKITYYSPEILLQTLVFNKWWSYNFVLSLLQTSPLIQATCHKNYADMVQLLQVGADPTVPNSHGITPIMYAASLVSVLIYIYLCVSVISFLVLESCYRNPY